MNRKLKKKLPIIVVGILALAIVAVVLLMTLNGDDSAYRGDGEDDSFVTIGGEKYEERPNLEKYLFYGVDVYSENDSDVPGQCDVIMLMVIDKAEDTLGVIRIDRNTKAKVFSYDKKGNVAGSAKVQIALSNPHGYDDESCARSVMDSVSDLFYGVSLSKYSALKMDSVGKLNHIVGGVTVTVRDDLTGEDSALRKGETVKLTDDQAEKFVRARMNVGKGTNEERMARQEEFLKGFRKAFMERYSEDEGFVSDAYDKLKDCMATDMTMQDFSKIAKAEMKNRDLGVFAPEGRNTVDDDGWTLFIPDRESIEGIATQLLFRKAE